MPGGRGSDVPLPRSVGVLSAADPMAPGSLARALIERLRSELPIEVAVALHGPLRENAAGAPSPGTLVAGTVRAASPADLAARSELLFVAIDDLDVLQRLIGGPSGVRAGIHSPTVLIVGGTCQPDALRAVAGRLHSSTAGLLSFADAPLTARPAELRAGQAPILAGASPATFARVEPVLTLLGPTTRVGGLGSGQVATACTQFLVASSTVALMETALLAQRCGLDIDRLFTSWRGAEVPERICVDVRDRMLGAGQSHLPMQSWRAPLAVAEAEARRTGTRSTLLNTVGMLYDRAVADGDRESDLLQRLLQVLSERPLTAVPNPPEAPPEPAPDVASNH